MGRTVVLVEGASDQNAVETLARRRGRDLAGEGVVVLAMGGVTNIGRFLDQHRGRGVRLGGLYDAAEERFVRRGLAGAGLGAQLDRAGMAELGFHVCEADLEDELIRALGVPAVLGVLEEQGDLPSFRILQRQPFHRGRPEHVQLRRFLGTHSGRKIEYAGLLVDALDLEQVPAPLDRVLESA